MNRIDKRFKELRRKKKKAFIVYVTAGDPNAKATERIILELDRCGVDILELGIPFSDPIADGPTIQAASQRSLSNNINIGKILGLVGRVRRATDIPIALMTYYNPVYIYGIKDFVKDAKDAGVDGIIVPDLPPEEAEELISYSRRANFKNIFLLSPTSSRERIKFITKKSSGFIYYVSLTGVTGARESLPKDIANNVKMIKRMTDKPVCVGFGVSTPKQARSIARIADGVIVGSAVIKVIEKNLKKRDIHKKVARFITSLIRPVKGI
ncbi:MAG: tryptophan synthase subunit alpha [Candidatus Omnitrophica bacterium]|nr:tryptophan synthase subunit alpha [Candidatus Omnitrophota bacterium]